MKWKPGQTGNPKGRPRTGNSLAETIRRKVSEEYLVEKLVEVLEKSASEQTQLRAIELLSDRGWKKPAQVVEVGPSDPFEDLSDEELAALEAHEQAVLAGGGALALGAGESGNVCPHGARAGECPVIECVYYGMSDADVVSEARPLAVEAAVGECRTTSHPVGKGGSVQVRKRVYPGDEDTDT